jgi:hypothetical protein
MQNWFYKSIRNTTPELIYGPYIIDPGHTNHRLIILIEAGVVPIARGSIAVSATQDLLAADRLPPSR